MADTEISNNKLHKTKHTRSTILSCRVGLDPVANSYFVGWIERTSNIPGKILCIYKHLYIYKNIGETENKKNGVKFKKKKNRR